MKQLTLTPTDQDLLGQLCGFAERYGENGVYLNFIRSVTRNQRYLVLVAVGDQADAVQKILLDAQAPNESVIEVISDLSQIEGSQW